MPESTPQAPIAIPKAVVIRDFAEKLKVPVTTVMRELLKNGIMSGMNERIDFDTASIIAEDLGHHVTLAEAAPDEPEANVTTVVGEEQEGDLEPRAPVVVVMGHVDHGKTLLLDTIRKTKVVEGEAGGITQSIGAYQAVVRERAITFLDTPGHEAFTTMRSRGARVADLAILVVAADDGVKPQTEEAIRLIREAKIPVVVAINKIDKDEANPEKVKQELAAKEILVEGYGGKVPAVQISAKTGQGIDELLETVLLVADLNKDRLRANPNRQAIGTIIEARMDAGEGPVATVLIHTGTLALGDFVVAGSAFGKVKSLRSFLGSTVKEAKPSDAVRIIGLKVAPEVGDILQVTPETKELKKKLKSWKPTSHATTVSRAGSAEETPEHAKERQAVNVVLKADTLGSLEAIEALLATIRHPEVAAVIVHKGLGNITEADVLRAQTAGALLLGFNVAVLPAAESVARGQDATIETYRIIYELAERVRSAMEARLTPEVIEEKLGRLSVLALFRTDATNQVVGGKVTDGKLVNQKKVRVLRNNALIATATIGQLQHNKQNTNEVANGLECGLKLNGTTEVHVGDTLECFDERLVKPALTLGRNDQPKARPGQ